MSGPRSSPESIHVPHPFRMRAISRIRPCAAVRLLPLLLLAAGGCGDDRMAEELASDLYARPLPVPAARSVDAGALPPAEAARPVDEARRVFSAGAEDGDERYVFGKIGDVAPSASGDTVYVTDRLTREVKAFDARGRFLFRFGRRGEGPGEYEDPMSITAVPWNGGVAVWDAKLQRLTVLTAAGEVLHTSSPLRQSDIAEQGKRLRAYEGGFLLEVRSDPYTVPLPQQRGHLVRLDTAGAVRDTLVEFAVPWVRGSTQPAPSGGLASWMTLNAPFFTPNPTWDVAPGHPAAFVPGGKYEVFRIADRGGVPLRITRPWEPARVTRKERWLNVRAWQASNDAPPQLPTFVVERLWNGRDYWASTRPALTGVLVDERGHVWAQRFDVRDNPAGFGRSRTWDGYATDGSPVGAVRFPPDFVPVAMRGGVAYGVRGTRLEVDRLEAYRL